MMFIWNKRYFKTLRCICVCITVSHTLTLWIKHVVQTCSLIVCIDLPSFGSSIKEQEVLQYVKLFNLVGLRRVVVLCLHCYSVLRLLNLFFLFFILFFFGLFISFLWFSLFYFDNKEAHDCGPMAYHMMWGHRPRLWRKD